MRITNSKNIYEFNKKDPNPINPMAYIINFIVVRFSAKFFLLLLPQSHSQKMDIVKQKLTKNII